MPKYLIRCAESSSPRRKSTSLDNVAQRLIVVAKIYRIFLGAYKRITNTHKSIGEAMKGNNVMRIDCWASGERSSMWIRHDSIPPVTLLLRKIPDYLTGYH